MKEPFAVINADDYYGRDAFVKLHDFLASDGDQKDWAMAGYVLENTITENGSVARGICEVEGGKLVKVTERTKIQENDGKIQYLEGEEWHDLDRRSIVSMNCWRSSRRYSRPLRDGFHRIPARSAGRSRPEEGGILPALARPARDRPGRMHGHGSRNEARSGTASPIMTTSLKFVNFITSEIAKGTYPDGLWK